VDVENFHNVRVVELQEHFDLLNFQGAGEVGEKLFHLFDCHGVASTQTVRLVYVAEGALVYLLSDLIVVLD